MRVELTFAAEIEFDEAVTYYDGQRPGLGAEFASEVLRAAQNIVDFPRAWQWLDEAEDIRRCQLNRFPYGLVYAIEGDVAIVLAVMHLKRHPEYWRERLKQRSGR